MKVLFISHTYVVGVNQGKLKAIVDAGIEVGLLAPQHWQAPQWNKQLDIETPYDQIRIYPARIQLGGRAGAHFYLPHDIAYAISDFDPDIIQVEEEVFSLVAFEIAIAARLYKIPVVLFGWENQERQLSLPRHWIRQFVFKTVSAIVAGNHDGAALVRQWGYDKKVEVMPQIGVDTELFSPVLSHTQPVDTALRIGFVGRISYHKGIETLLSAAQKLRQQKQPFELRLCGSGPDEAKFKSLAKAHDLDEITTWRGGVRHDEVPEEISKMDVLVLPSLTIPTWKEQFGHVLIEAMAAGLPVVGSTCGEIPNVIGEQSLIFPEGDAVALTAILRRFIQEPSWRQAMVEHSLNSVEKYYSHSRIAERLIALWKDILQDGVSLNANSRCPQSAKSLL